MQFVRLLHKLQGVSSDSLSGNFLVDDKGMFIMDSDGKLIEVSTLPPVEPGLVYHTNFSNFDTQTYTDTPIYGPQSIWSNNGIGIQPTSRTVDGVEYPCLYFYYTGGSGLTLTNLSDFFDTSSESTQVVSIECTVYKDGMSGNWGGCTKFGIISPYYNCWSSDRGIGIWWPGYTYMYSGFYHKHDAGGVYPTTGSTDVCRLVTAGVTRAGTQYKVYFDGKKALTGTNDGNNYLDFHIDGSGMDFCVMDMKIYVDRDRFEEMEG